MKIKLLHPLISCICITKQRSNRLLKSIRNFEEQNYPNKELIISYPIDDSESRSLMVNLLKATSLSLILIEREIGDSIGFARNKAIEICNGDFVCMWDDDDLYQYTRISDQFNLLQGRGRYFHASIISKIILFDSVKSDAYLSFNSIWQGTLLCKKVHLLKNPCVDTSNYECGPVIEFLITNKLLMNDFPNPFIYIYVYHRGSIVDYQHFQYYTKLSTKLPDEIADNIQNYINQDIKINVL